MEQPKMQPADLTKEELVALVEDILDTLWPRGNSEHEWDASTADTVAQSLAAYGLDP
jgi:hypothetical protein